MSKANFSDEFKRDSTTPRWLKKRLLSVSAIYGYKMKAVWLLSEPSLGAIWGMSV